MSGPVSPESTIHKLLMGADISALVPGAELGHERVLVKVHSHLALSEVEWCRLDEIPLSALRIQPQAVSSPLERWEIATLRLQFSVEGTRRSAHSGDSLICERRSGLRFRQWATRAGSTNSGCDGRWLHQPARGSNS